MEKSVLLERIEALNVKESWKQKFRLYAEAGLKSGNFFPTFENTKILKGKFLAKFNPFACLFYVFYYLYLGLYKKAGMIVVFFLVLQFLMGLTGSIIAPRLSYPMTHIILFILILLNFYFYFVYFSMSANYDYYRKQVLGENFWW